MWFRVVFRVRQIRDGPYINSVRAAEPPHTKYLTSTPAAVVTSVTATPPPARGVTAEALPQVPAARGSASPSPARPAEHSFFAFTPPTEPFQHTLFRE